MKLRQKILSGIAVLVMVDPFTRPAVRAAGDDTDLHDLYQRMNLEYFGGQLPKADVEYGNLDNDYGETTFNGPSITIILDINENVSESDVRVTLQHEMCHVQVFPDQTHGLDWQKCMERFTVR